MQHLAGLNPAQRSAAVFGVNPGAAPSPPLLVIAGAGSGKTGTLAHRVAHLIVNGAEPSRILLMTFSRRAAADLSQRVERIVARATGAEGTAAALAWSGTFHAIGARLLRELAPQIGLPPDFSIHDREDSADLMNLARHAEGLGRGEKRFPAKGTCLAIYSRAVNSGEALSDILPRHFPWCAGWEAELKRLFAAYVAAKQAQDVLDYDDLLLAWAEVMAEPAHAALIGARWDHVLIDEYQDTNRLQARILAGLKPDGRGLTVVGDDAQAIYAFRAATVRNILDFPHQFSPPAEVVTLDRNYRSTAPILAAANAVIGAAAERYAKALWTDRSAGPKPRLMTVAAEAEQARAVAEGVLENREAGVALKEQAVLFRTASHSGPLEIELTRRNIPFVKFGGLKFLDSAHVKDLLALIRFAANPLDRVAGFRALQLPAGVGPKAAGRLLDALAGVPRPQAALADLPCPSRADPACWAGLLAALAVPGWPDALAATRDWYAGQLERLHEDPQARAADLLQLEQIAAGFPSRARFLTDLTLDPPEAAGGQGTVPMKDDDYLILSTIHSAKGQEWRRVFVLNVVDGCIPSDLGTGSRDEIEEERRLLYVAMTRARDELTLGLPLRFHVTQQARRGDRHLYAVRSRFLTSSMLDLFDQRPWHAPEAAAPAAPAPPALDLGARMRARWG